MEHRPRAARPAQFSDLDGCIINAIVRCLDPASRAAFAATSLAHLSAVLEATPGRWSSAGRYGEAVAQRLHAHGCQAAGSRVGWAVSRNWRMYCRAGADPTDDRSIVRVVATKVLRLTKMSNDEALKCRMDPPPITAGMEALELLDIRGTDSAVLEGEDWIPRPARATLRKLWASDCKFRSLPPGMTSLQELHAADSGDLPHKLPESSRAAVRALSVSGTVPPGMRALQLLLVCGPTTGAWLPASSAASLTTLALSNSGIRRLPPGLVALRRLDLNNCEELEVDFLPADSSRQLVDLHVSSPIFDFTVPPNLDHLERLYVRCLTFGDDWLPVSSKKSLRCLTVRGGGLRSVPPGLEQLEELTLQIIEKDQEDLDRANDPEELADYLVILDRHWLPPSSRRRIKKLDLSGTNVERIPAGCEALEELVVARCEGLYVEPSEEAKKAWEASLVYDVEEMEPWIDACSAAKVRRLDASSSNVTCVPATFTALEYLNVSECTQLVDDWMQVPLHCRGSIRELLCVQCNGRPGGRAGDIHMGSPNLVVPSQRGICWIPSGMTALQELYAGGCNDLNGFLGASSSQSLRKLSIGGTRITRIRDMPCLEDLDVRGCKHLAEDFVDEVSRRSVARLDAAESNLRRVPAHMMRLRDLIVTGCKELAEDWLEGLPDGADVLVRGDGRRQQRVVVAQGKVVARRVR